MTGPLPSAPFCGRDQEMQALKAAYDAVDGTRGGPQLVVLLGEQGEGKTRLAQEFYNWLATERDTGSDYWPDRMSEAQAERDINPALAQGSGHGQGLPPFLWLGIKCREAIEGVGAPRQLLEPHLKPLRMARARRRWAMDVVEQGGLFLINLFPLVGPVISQLWQHSKSAKKAKDAIFGAGPETHNLGEEQARVQQEAIEALIDDFGSFLDDADRVRDFRAQLRRADRMAGGFRQCPVVILLDDAQFAAIDPFRLRFIDQLLQTARLRSWPLLLVATHWAREWNLHLADESRPSFARVAADWAAREPGWRPVTLSRQGDATYGELVRRIYPNLPPDQVAAILAKGDGNPRMINELVGHLRGKDGWFENHDTSRPLTAEGLARLTASDLTLRRLVEARMSDDSTSAACRVAAALSSMQGLEFLGALTVEVADRLGLVGAEDGVRQTQNPHVLSVELAPDAYAFVQSIYREVALDSLQHVAADPVQARQVLTEVVRQKLADAEAMAAMDTEARKYLWRIGADIFSRSDVPADRGQRAALLLQLASDAAQSMDVFSVTAYVETVLHDVEALKHLPDGLRVELIWMGWSLSDLNRQPLMRELIFGMLHRYFPSNYVDDDENGLIKTALFSCVGLFCGELAELSPGQLTLIGGAYRWFDQLRVSIEQNADEQNQAFMDESNQLVAELKAAAQSGDLQAQLELQLEELELTRAQLAKVDWDKPVPDGSARAWVFSPEEIVVSRRIKILQSLNEGALNGNWDRTIWTPERDGQTFSAMREAINACALGVLSSPSANPHQRREARSNLIEVGRLLTMRGQPYTQAAILEQIEPEVLALATKSPLPSAARQAHWLERLLSDTDLGQGRSAKGLERAMAARAWLAKATEVGHFDDLVKLAIFSLAGRACARQLNPRAGAAFETEAPRDLDRAVRGASTLAQAADLASHVHAVGVDICNKNGWPAQAISIFEAGLGAIDQVEPMLGSANAGGARYQFWRRISECAGILGDADGVIEAQRQAADLADRVLELEPSQEDRMRVAQERAQMIDQALDLAARDTTHPVRAHTLIDHCCAQAETLSVLGGDEAAVLARIAAVEESVRRRVTGS